MIDLGRVQSDEEQAWAAHERCLIAYRLGLEWSEDDGYEGSAEENERLRRAFAKNGCLPTSASPPSGRQS